MNTALPEGSKVVSADSFGSSAWTVTARINTVSSEGETKPYFLKVSAASRTCDIHVVMANSVRPRTLAEAWWKVNTTP